MAKIRFSQTLGLTFCITYDPLGAAYWLRLPDTGLEVTLGSL